MQITPPPPPHAQVLAQRRGKDPVPLAVVAENIAKLAVRAFELGKQFHLLLTGCNTVNVVLPICKQVDRFDAAAKQSIWVLATNSVWPGDLSTFLWSQYGSTASPDLAEYRSATRILLDEYTTHWRRQKVMDASMESKKAVAVASLADLVLLDRLDRVRDESGFAVMGML
jgi:hypothetical protein